MEIQELHKSKSLYLPLSSNSNNDSSLVNSFVNITLQLDVEQLENLKNHNITQADLEDYETIHLEEEFG